jgi:hypothetical protein
MMTDYCELTRVGLSRKNSDKQTSVALSKIIFSFEYDPIFARYSYQLVSGFNLFSWTLVVKEALSAPSLPLAKFPKSVT